MIEIFYQQYLVLVVVGGNILFFWTLRFSHDTQFFANITTDYGKKQKIMAT